MQEEGISQESDDRSCEGLNAETPRAPYFKLRPMQHPNLRLIVEMLRTYREGNLVAFLIGAAPRLRQWI